MRTFAARWVTPQERAADHEHNGVVEANGAGPYPPQKFYVGPMALAERVADALNFTAKFSDEELKRLAAAITS